MALLRGTENRHDSAEMRWGPMLGLSLVFHLALFFIIFFVPETTSSARPSGSMTYEVNLVELPKGGAGKSQGSKPEQNAKKTPLPVKKIETRRIKAPEKTEKPLIIAKRTVEKKAAPVIKSSKSPSELIEKAISKIEKKIEKEDRENYVERAISKLEKESGVAGAEGIDRPDGGSLGGMPMEIYRMEAENWIKSNWSYPVAMDNVKDLEAVVVVMVKRDGGILKTKFEKRSSNLLFDESVSKAIERSDPLPPFPEGYRKSYEEFIINFNLKDFERP
ncbi:MAG: TonB C-terminal domain-containing protein [Pseudomonadota bacterium]